VLKVQGEKNTGIEAFSTWVDKCNNSDEKRKRKQETAPKPARLAKQKKRSLFSCSY
jgi:hypothetical protein